MAVISQVGANRFLVAGFMNWIEVSDWMTQSKISYKQVDYPREYLVCFEVLDNLDLFVLKWL